MTFISRSLKKFDSILVRGMRLKYYVHATEYENLRCWNVIFKGCYGIKISVSRSAENLLKN